MRARIEAIQNERLTEVEKFRKDSDKYWDEVYPLLLQATEPVVNVPVAEVAVDAPKRRGRKPKVLY